MFGFRGLAWGVGLMIQNIAASSGLTPEVEKLVSKWPCIRFWKKCNLASKG